MRVMWEGREGSSMTFNSQGVTDTIKFQDMIGTVLGSNGVGRCYVVGGVAD